MSLLKLQVYETMSETSQETSLQTKCAGILYSILSSVPLTILSATGSFIGGLLSYIPGRDREIARLQLSLMLPEVTAQDVLYQLYRRLGSNTLEMFSVSSLISRAHIRVPEECEAYIKEITEEPRPVICLTGHVSNWDLMGAFFVHRNLPVVTIGRKARSPFLHALLSHIRNSYGIKTIWRNSQSETRDLINAFKKKEIIAALIDQDTRVKSIPIPFFGMTAAHPVSLLSLGKRFNADVVTTFLVQTGAKSFDVHFKRLPQEASEEELLLAYSQTLEEIIRANPDQWVWFHKRWRTRDDDTVLGSSDYIRWLQEQLPS